MQVPGVMMMMIDDDDDDDDVTCHPHKIKSLPFSDYLLTGKTQWTG